MTKKLTLLSILAVSFVLSACTDDAVVASRNLSKAADNFEIHRRVIFYNGITDSYLLNIEGLCSITDQKTQLEVTCKTGDDEYKKHFLGLSDNVTYFAEQLKGKDVNVFHYRVTFKPQEIIPDIDFRGSSDEVIEAVVPDSKDK